MPRSYLRSHLREMEEVPWESPLTEEQYMSTGLRIFAQFAGAVVSGDTVECEADLPGLNRGIAAAIAHGALVSSVSPAESSLEEAFRTAVAR